MFYTHKLQWMHFHIPDEILFSVYVSETEQQQQQQQQQQHSLLSQASWGRLEMKPKRDEKQGDT
jgi:hypothetical protein